MRAAALPAAVGAVQHRRIAAPVQEHQALLAAVDAFLQRREQRRRQRRARRCGRSAARSCRPAAPAAARRRRCAPAATAAGSAPRVARCQLSSDGVAEPSTHGRAVEPAAVDGQVARRVARAFLLLVRRVVFLVDDDQAQAAASRRTPRAACRAPGRPGPGGRRASGAGAAPASAPLCSETMRRPAKRCAKRASSCGVRLISGTSTSACRPGRQRLRGGAQVHLGLAAAGHAVQQRRGAAPAGGGASSSSTPRLVSALSGGASAGPRHGRGAATSALASLRDPARRAARRRACAVRAAAPTSATSPMLRW